MTKAVPVYRDREKLGQRIEQIGQKVSQIDKIKEDILGNIDRKFKEEKELREKEFKEKQEKERSERERIDKERLEKDKEVERANKALEDARKRGLLENGDKLIKEIEKGITCPTCVDSKGIKKLAEGIKENIGNVTTPFGVMEDEMKKVHEKFHKLEKADNTGLSLKCTGPNCGKEYVLADRDADFKCTGCGFPIKRPEDKSKDIENCPLCGSEDAVKFNWKVYRDMKKRREETKKRK